MDNVAMLVSTFDVYAPCWKPLCHSFEKYWPAHPKLYFVTNFRQADCGESIQVGEDRGWSNNIAIALEKIPAPYILYTQEDYWIERPVDVQNILEYVALLESGRADYIRLSPGRRSFIDYPADPRLVMYPKDALYRTSLHMALWRKAVLQDLIEPGESAWGFETSGTERSRKYGGSFMCVISRRFGVYYTSSAIVRGVWSRVAHEYAEREGIQVDFEALPKKPFLKRQIYYTRRTLKRLKKKILNQV